MWEELQARCGRSILCALSRPRTKVEKLHQANAAPHMQLASRRAEVEQLRQQIADAVLSLNQ